MGKSLIIKNVDFSSVAVDDGVWEVISSSQVDAGGYYTDLGAFNTNIPEIKGVVKIPVPSGKTKIRFTSSATGNEPSAVSVFINNADTCSSVGGNVGVINPIGTKVFVLPANTTHISYVYSNTYGSYNYIVGLASVIEAK